MTRELAEVRSTLELTYEELIRSEKLAGLGALVAGVAHELNMPIGTTVMVASTMRDMGPRFYGLLAEGLKRSELDSFLQDLQEASEIMERNLLRAAEMLKSFKQVAVDQSSHQRRPFMLTEIANELRLTLSPLFKRSPISLTLDVDPAIRMNSYPGLLSQVMMNLVNNTLVHAFEDYPEGEIRCSAHICMDGYVKLVVVDNGCGIEPEVLLQIFDPFFTTKLGKRGGAVSGLILSMPW